MPDFPLPNYSQDALFTSTDRNLQRKDSEFWLIQLRDLLEFYKKSDVESENGVELKALHCARLAGYALSLLHHFSTGTTILLSGEANEADVEACSQAAVRIVDGCDRHCKRLESEAQALQS